MSKQQKLIYDLVVSSRTHPTAEELTLSARRFMPHIAFGTVYRNLQLLTEEGRIRKIDMPQGGARYDHVQYEHAHCVCEDCGRIVDAPLEVALSPSALPEGMTWLGAEIRIRCRCADCNTHTPQA